jgi:CRISPR-associated endonuclease/helicase Cas3
MSNRRLLAKSYDRNKYSEPPDYALLIQHSRDVAAACKALAKMTGAIALQNAGLSPEKFTKFERTLLTDGWMQDLGKANSHFLEMLFSSDRFPQLLRHETISGILTFLDERFCDWLEPLGELKIIAVWGAIGHHRKFDHDTKADPLCSPLTVYLTHPDLKTILEEMAQDLELDPPPTFESDLLVAPNKDDSCDLPARESVRDLKDEFRDFEKQFQDEESRRFIALVKAFGIAADIAASAIAKQGKSAQLYSLSKFVDEALAIGLTPTNLEELIKERKARSGISTLLNFQERVAESTSYLTLAEAGCGSGKSLAAYLWAKRWCEQLMEEGRTNIRMFFCLPTTGTTTEHFKDYALESGIEDVQLVHSRASVDLQTMMQTAVQEEAEADDATKAVQQALKAEHDKIEALSLWSTPLAVTTADTVLGLMANSRRGVCSIPAIMQSMIVFDEIHAFDEELFGHLLVFLKNFPKLPVLLMTASLPEERRKAIETVRNDLQPIPGPPDRETLPRYLIEYPTTQEVAWERVQQCVTQLDENNQGKVLWVCNRVDWANRLYHLARNNFPEIPVYVYHSRLRYKDRSKRHRQVIDKFKQQNQPVILIATQVAEMSLDLSADLLITDIAPVPALIQRMGRLNRRATPENPGQPKSALICPLSAQGKNPKHNWIENLTEYDAKPYEVKDLQTAEKWIQKLLNLNQPLSQKHLSDGFADPDISNPKEFNMEKAEERACFFSGLWRTRPGMTRGEGHTISVILQQDLDKCTEFEFGQPSRDWLRKHEVSIPVKEAALKWERLAGIRIAPDNQVEYDQYDEAEAHPDNYQGTGARWL